MTRDGLVYYLIFKWWLRLSDLIWQFLFHDEKNILSIKSSRLGLGLGLGLFFLLTTLLNQLYVRFGTCGEHLHDHRISISRLYHHFLLKCLYKSREVRGHVFVLDVSILPVSTNFGLSFVTVLTVWYFTSYCYKQ